ncbi:MAG: SDR family NAD(P)-dependent oxidoreductase [Pseudomonadales bacterium]
MSQRRIKALVTGASSGIGAEYCRQLAAFCDEIIMVARREQPMAELAAQLRANGTEVHVIVADLTDTIGVAKVVETIRQKGPLDYLVNNAGVSTHGSFTNVALDAQRVMIDLHIHATMTLSYTALPAMEERGSGVIINVSSLGAFTVLPDHAVYAASKAFLNTFSLSLQAEVLEQGVKIQCLCPGYTRTEIHQSETFKDFDISVIPEDMWSDVGDVVTNSLVALKTDATVVVSDENSYALAKGAWQHQLQSQFPT